MKIIQRKSLGIQTVYDIGVVQDHNFILADGLVASNCFNKSHSTAYAYVTYQTAYLKANYPVEYMTALLTASSGNQEKVEKYRENAQRMGIEVEPPDINRSQVDFTPIGRTIIFGLSAVRNLGEGAIESILEARQAAGGKFKSLADLCIRVDLRLVNRRALETLILCGAFDKINPNRKQLFEHLDLVIAWAQRRHKEKESGQTNLFDWGQNSSKEIDNNPNNISCDDVPSAPAIADYSPQEKLQQEKEILGFYVSAHPLKTIQESAKLLSPVNLKDLNTQKAKQKISAVVVVNAVKKITTQQGKQMAFIQIEDASGQGEGIIFPDTYTQIEQFLVNDARLIIWGKVQQKDDRYQIIVDQAELIEQVRLVMVELSSEKAIDALVQKNLRGILQEQSGDKNKAKIPVVAIINFGDQRKFIRLGQEFWVQDDTSTINALNNARFKAYPRNLITNTAN